MDIDLARTFLEVAQSGSFVAAAERLHVTQSTVSTRIRQLEELLGGRLFVRNKAGASLTPAGAQFQRHAVAMVRIWEQARQEAALPPGHRAMLRIGSEAGLWNRLLHRWIPWMRRNARDIALRCEVGLPDGLANALREGVLDLAVCYSARSLPGLRVRLLCEEELVLLSVEGRDSGAADDDYVLIDWGEDFRRQYRLHNVDAPMPPLSISMGTLGLDYLTQCGGTGHFPKALAQPLLDAGIARVVSEERPYSLPIYAIHPADADASVLEPAFAGLRAIVGG
ncbi:LysR family transcriptional regulator [Azospirillum sp.]|uniref:LysR family transcriptional regulator n=1 Tax=Azospirillum sp. TaxID=34012 RepID=UPI002D4EC4D6|nr:LysR family transcriptional regulator [Azospirillum sp.]HYD70118.1 LysR family transcriptional regulator [Azospirillum sp.]